MDAAISRSGAGGAIAAVCRTPEGRFHGASSVTIRGLSDPATLEALACNEALALARDLSCLCVASDCRSVIKNLEMENLCHCSAITKDIEEGKKLFQEIVLDMKNVCLILMLII